MECDVAPSSEDRILDPLAEKSTGTVVPGGDDEANKVIEHNAAKSTTVDDAGHTNKAQPVESMKITLQKEKRPIEQLTSTTASSTDESDPAVHQKKAAKTVVEKGTWKCKNESCNEEDDDCMFTCKRCDGMYHYRCTDLPLYEIVRYAGPGRRVYECASCVKIPEKLKTYKMKGIEPTTTSSSSQTSFPESGNKEYSNNDLAKKLTSLEKDVVDKDFLIRSQKEIIEKIRTKTQVCIDESIETSDVVLALKGERDELLENTKAKDKEIAECLAEITRLKGQLEKKAESPAEAENGQLENGTEAFNNLKDDRDELVALVKRKNEELGECSVTIENLKKELEGKEMVERSTDKITNETVKKLDEMTDSNRELTRRLEEKTVLVGKMESLVESKQDLVSAKNEIIDNLKIIISTMKNEKEDGRSEPNNLTSNVISGGLSSEEETPQAANNGVTESCEFLQIHGTNGVIMNPFLLWADIQRKMNPENLWKESAQKKFVNTEITEAKETLWRVSGEEYLGKMVRRQGSGKSTSEIADICGAFKKLVEKDKLPLFLCTSGMVASTPIYTGDSPGIDSRELNDHLNKIDVSISKAVNTITETMEARLAVKDDPVSNSDKATKHVNTALGETISVNDVVDQQSENSDRGWNRVPRRGQRSRNERPLPSHQTYLVVSNVGLEVEGLQIVHYLENKDINVADCTLLTTRDDATFLTYRITVSKADADKLKDDRLWPDETEIRPFKLSKKQRGDGNSGRKHGNRPEGQSTRETFDRRNLGTNTEAARSLQAGINHPGNVYPSTYTYGIPNTANTQKRGRYADVLTFGVPSNGVLGRNPSLGNYATDNTMKDFVRRSAQMGTHRNTPRVNNVQGSMLNDFVEHSAPVGNFNTEQIAQGNSWYDTGLVNNQRGIINGRTVSAGHSFPGNVKRGTNWSDVCDVPRVRFVDRLGTDQFQQQ